MEDKKEKKNKEKKLENIKNNIAIFLIHYFKTIIIFIIFFILIFGYFFVTAPKIKSYSEKKTIDNEERQLNYLSKAKELEKMLKIIEVYKEIDKSDIEKINFMLPEEDSHENLLSYIETIVLNNGLNLIDLKIETEDAVKKINYEKNEDENEDDLPLEIKKVKVELSVIGTNYDIFRRFLNNIENDLRLINIVDLSFDPVGYSTFLTFYTYYLEK